jgi:hypothetical protein
MQIDIGHCYTTSPGQGLGDTADMILPHISGSDNSGIDGHFGNAIFVFKTCRESLKRVSNAPTLASHQGREFSKTLKR